MVYLNRSGFFSLEIGPQASPFLLDSVTGSFLDFVPFVCRRGSLPGSVLLCYLKPISRLYPVTRVYYGPSPSSSPTLKP